MITSIEYIDKLKEISLLDYKERKVIPEEEPIFNVYLNSRTIEAPTSFNQLAVEGDHLAETIWFSMDRYFDGVDLSTKVVGVKYKTSLREGILPVDYSYVNSEYEHEDEKEDEKTLMVGWSIPFEVTELAGPVSVGLVIYSLTQDEQIDYSLNIKPFNSTIGKSLHVDAESENIYPPADVLSSILDKLNDLYENGDFKTVNYEDLFNKPKLNNENIIDNLKIDAISFVERNGDNLIFNVDYNKLINIPKINGVTLMGDVSGKDLNISIDVDSALSESSINPVENKVVTSNITLINQEIERIKEEMDGMTFIPLSISDFANNINLAEKGSTVETVDFTWKMGGNPISISIDDTSVVDLTATSASLSGLTIQDDHIFTLSAQDRKGNSAEATTDIAFVYKVYHGVSAVPDTYSEDFIKELTGTLQKTKETTINVNAAEGQYIYYCVPASYGDCIFTSGGFSGGFTKVDTILCQNDYNVSTNYDIWKSDNAGLGATIITIS